MKKTIDSAHARLVGLVLLALATAQVQSMTVGEPQKVYASDGVEGDLFSFGVSVMGDIAVIGASGDDDYGSGSGAAYIFERDSTGTWAQVARLSALDAGLGQEFGRNVSVSGDTILVAALGAAHTFRRDSMGAWAQESKLTPNTGTPHEWGGRRFGSAVAISGDVAVAGAPLDYTPIHAGAAYVFERDGSGAWSQAAKIVPGDGINGAYFGHSVSISGETVVIGAPLDDDHGIWSGSAYLFQRQADGVWGQVAKLTAADGAADDMFGYGVSISGDAVIVGAWQDDGESGTNSGSAYIFERDASGTWAQKAKLIKPGGQYYGAFGRCVSISGNTALVGTGTTHGFAQLYERGSDGNWTPMDMLWPDDPSLEDSFGGCVAVSADTVLVSAVADPTHGYHAGAAYLFPYASTQAPELTLDGPASALKGQTYSGNGRIETTLPVAGGSIDFGDGSPAQVTV